MAALAFQGSLTNLTSHVPAYYMDSPVHTGMVVNPDVARDQEDIATNLSIYDQVAAEHDYRAVHPRVLLEEGVIREQKQWSCDPFSACQGEIGFTRQLSASTGCDHQKKQDNETQDAF